MEFILWVHTVAEIKENFRAFRIFLKHFPNFHAFPLSSKNIQKIPKSSEIHLNFRYRENLQKRVYANF